jgi:hypothetical protein
VLNLRPNALTKYYNQKLNFSPMNFSPKGRFNKA